MAPDFHCLSTTPVFTGMTVASEVFFNVMRYINLLFTCLLNYTPFQPSVRFSNSRIVLVVHVVVLLVAFGKPWETTSMGLGINYLHSHGNLFPQLFNVQIDEVPK